MPQCTAIIIDPDKGVRRTCLNPGVVAVTEIGGSREVYCVGHNALREEFLAQVKIDQERWRSVPQVATGASS